MGFQRRKYLHGEISNASDEYRFLDVGKVRFVHGRAGELFVVLLYVVEHSHDICDGIVVSATGNNNNNKSLVVRTAAEQEVSDGQTSKYKFRGEGANRKKIQ